MVANRLAAATLTTAVIFLLTIQSGESIHCWDCNSAYDPRCGDPFDNHSIALVDCSQMSYVHLNVKEATLCRKTSQQINGKMRVVRSCGWLNSTNEDEGASCFKRSGSQDVYITHCTCNTDGCNGATSVLPTAILITPLLGAVLNYLSTLVTHSHL